MQMAKIFRPIRWPHTARADEGPSAFPSDPGGPANRNGRVGTQPVTNPSPPDPSARPAPIADTGSYTEEDEGAWLALLELIFETTGWPDAE
jgi:hypothetical protein